MCRYVCAGYSDKYICLDCRISFKSKVPRVCKCGKDMVNVGKDFRPPRQTNLNQWKKVRTMVAYGQNFRTCGCAGPGKMPKTFADAKRTQQQRNTQTTTVV